MISRNCPLLSMICRLGCAFVALLFLLPGLTWAEMTPMTDEELSAISGHGFTRFTLTQENGLDVARMDINFRAGTFTEIESMKMGYYDGGWDESWLGVSMGSSANDLALGGFYFEAQFIDINDASTRQLQRVTIGWQSVTGTVAADFSSFTGHIRGAEHDRQDLGPTTIHLNDERFSMTLDVVSGISFAIGNPP